MSMTPLYKRQCRQMVDHILHTPGNRIIGNQLEITFVLDVSGDKAFVLDRLKEISSDLKKHNPIFENVRCNILHWNIGICSTQVIPMSFAALGRVEFPEMVDTEKGKKFCLEELTAYLKLFQARSRCIIVITEGKYQIQDRKKLSESLAPFLKSRLLLVTPEEVISGGRIFAETVLQ